MTDPFDVSGGFRDTGSDPFLAGWDSECATGDHIYEGDDIVMHEGEAWHLECFEEEMGQTS